MPLAPERLNELVVAGLGISTVGAGSDESLIDIVPPVNAPVVEHDDGDGEMVPADGLNLHPAESKGTVALNGDDLSADSTAAPMA